MRSVFKKAAKNIGLLSIANQLTSKKLNIVLYHGFSSNNSFESVDNMFIKRFISHNDFEQHLKLYIKYARPTSLLEILIKRELPKNSLIITIDDGYENNYSIAYPILKKYEIPATIFLTTGFIDSKNVLWTDWLSVILHRACNIKKRFYWKGKSIELDMGSKKKRDLTLKKIKTILKKMKNKYIFDFLSELQVFLQVEYSWNTMPKELRPLKWEQIREMKQSGLISFGSHTVSHPILSKCNDKAQQYELYESKRRIEEELNEPCLLFSYPNGKIGDYNARTVEKLKINKYELAVTTELGYNHLNCRNRYELKRWGSNVSKENLAFVISGVAFAFKKFR
jgi:peptidoglycan/xylan/chitin deacetylase (PgdA/CDA1 family)